MLRKTLVSHIEESITWEKCPGCETRIRANHKVILYPHDTEDCRLSDAYGCAVTDDERDAIIRTMQAKTDRETGQSPFDPDGPAFFNGEDL